MKIHGVEPGKPQVAEMNSTETRLPGGWLVQGSPFAILLAAGVWLDLHWQKIPERFPVHWGMEGQPNGWASRSLFGVYSPLAVGAAVCAGLTLLNYGIAAFSRRAHARGPAGEVELRFRNMMLWLLLSVEILMALLFSWVSLFALRNSQAGPHPATVMMVSLAAVAAILFLSLRLARGGARRAEARGSEAALGSAGSPAGDRTLERYWKAGMFYVNDDDPAIIVEKRFGIGFTLNFGHPLSWVILFLLVAVPLGFVFLMAHLR
jgi:uncharacterized membrane protein